MNIQPYARAVGYENFDQVAQRTVWTCGALTIGSLIAPVFFKNFNVKTHVFFGAVEGAAFNLTVHNGYLAKIEEKFVEFSPEHQETMEGIARAIQFTLVCAVPLYMAKKLTSWFFETISRSHMFKVGVLYNGSVVIASAYGYESLRDKML